MQDNYDIIKECVGRLQDISGLKVKQKGESNRVKIGVQGKPGYALEIKILPHHGLLLPDAAGDNIPTVICARHFSKQAAEKLKNRNAFYLDTTGNMFIRGDGIFLFGFGNTPTKAITSKYINSPFHKAGLKLAWALLKNPLILQKTERDIAKEANISTGAVHQLLFALDALKIIRLNRKIRVLEQPQILLERWIQGYVERLRPQLLIGAYRTSEDMEAFLERLGQLPGNLRPIIGGELGATLRHEDLFVPGTATLHLLPEQETYAREICRNLRIAPTNKDPNVFLVKVIGNASSMEVIRNICVADPVQTLGELAIQETDRLDEIRAILVKEIIEQVAVRHA